MTDLAQELRDATLRVRMKKLNEVADLMNVAAEALDAYRGVVIAALNWRQTYGFPTTEINEKLIEALDEIDTTQFGFEPRDPA